MSDDATPKTSRHLGGISLNFIPAAAGDGQPTASRAVARESVEVVEARVVIVGSGPAGLTAAIYAARANLQPVVIGGLAAGGQLMITSDVENYPGFPDGIQGPELMGLFRKQAERFGARVVDVDVERIDLGRRPFRLWAAGVEYRAEAVIVATGAEAIWLGIDSETRLRGRGVSACATCDGFFYRDKEVGVVGGGDSAFEEALFLTRFASKVYLVHRRDTLRATKIMAGRTTSHPKIQMVWDSVPVEAQGVGAGAVSGLKVKNVKTGAERVLPGKGIFVAIGHVPNTQPFAQTLDVDENGYFKPAAGSQVKTRVPGVYVAGDCADHIYRQAVTAAGMGCQAAIETERWLAEHGG